jgi:hypothetical protein
VILVIKMFYSFSLACPREKEQKRRAARTLRALRARASSPHMPARHRPGLRRSVRARPRAVSKFGFWLLAFSFWSLAFSFWSLAFSFWSLAFSFWSLAFSFWSLAFGVQR